MNFYLQCLVDFIGIFLIIFIIYTVFINKKRKEYEQLKKSSEVRLIIDRYNLNMRKIKYKNLLLAISLINSFIISFTVVIVINIKNIGLSILFGFLTIIILTYASYEILGKYYRKKDKEDV